MINCIGIDQDESTLELLTNCCQEIEFLDLQKNFTSTIEAARYIRKHPIDLVFINTQVGDNSGLEFFEAFKQSILVVFLSEVKDLAVEAFALNAMDYLLKPFDTKRFNQAANKVNEYYNYRNQNRTTEDQYLHVRSEYSLVKIAFVEILYIETLDDYIKIHLLGKKPILTLMTLKTVGEKLPSNEFIRVHRSFIVPISKIESVRGKIINLGITEVPIGKSHEENFFKSYISQGF